MNNVWAFKTIGLTAMAGMLLAWLLAIAISEVDQYYDWLLVEQSVWLGLIAGSVAGAGYVYFHTKKLSLTKMLGALKARFITHDSPYSPKPVETSGVASEPGKTSGSGIWSTIWRSGLGGLLGLLSGGIGGIWYCVDSYGDQSREAQGWLIIYLPVYAIISISCAAMGCVIGVILGNVWSALRSSRS
ncbi:hypothetical protein GO755_10635 [Spirosoma sp. HMF4905]|uniref:Uncharacterized protein n=1 Tax=Spirosoma arboris TaxID=2682092 RepID=A0A7K1S9N5_9BACT|nr:hypothetical protein [Spirosoma arboris]MVM30490.1 hypothetical protein [Spirosoma arboris]